jgi:integrase
MALRGWTDGNQLKGLKVPTSPRPHFDLIPDDIRAKLFSLYSPDTFLGSRNLALLAVLSDTGLRREEVARLEMRHVDLTGRVLRVFSDKVTEWRYVPLTDETVAYLHNYLKWRQKYFASRGQQRIHAGATKRTRVARVEDTEHLFLSWNGHCMRPEDVGQTLSRASKKLGVRIHPHLFRHDWITRKALDGENPSIVRRWAGHKTFSMTDYYFELADEMLAAIKPKKSVLAGLALPGKPRRGRPTRSAAE